MSQSRRGRGEAATASGPPVGTSGAGRAHAGGPSIGGRGLFGLPMLYWGLWLAILILWMGRFVMSFLSIYLVSDLHIDEGTVGTVVSMYGFGAILGCLFGGALSDRFGRQPMIVIGELGAAAILVAIAFLTSPVALGAALFAYGAVASLPSPAIAAYIADVVPAANRQRAYTLQSWAINFGYAIGPIIANQLVKISYALMFYVEAAILVGVTVLLAVFFREVGHLGITVPGPRGRAAVRGPVAGRRAAGGRAGTGHADGVQRAGAGASPEASRPDADAGMVSASASAPAQALAPASASSSDSPASPARVSLLGNYRRAVTDLPFAAFVLLVFGYLIVYYQSTSGLPIAMTDLGMGTAEYSVLLTINGGMLCLLQIPAMKLFRRMGNSRVLVAGLAVTVVGYAVQVFATDWAGFALAVVLWTLGELGTFPIAATVVAAMAPADARGTYQGLYNMAMSLALAFAPMAGGAIIAASDGRTLWTVCTAVLALVTLGLLLTRHGRERSIARNLTAVEVDVEAD